MAAKAAEAEKLKWVDLEQRSFEADIHNDSGQVSGLTRAHFTQDQLAEVRDELHVIVDDALVAAEAQLAAALEAKDVETFIHLVCPELQ